jgi:hypothetical protein
MPQIIWDDEHNMLAVIYSSVTETYDNGTSNFRHLWQRISASGGESWSSFKDLTEDESHQFDECVFPSLATASGGSSLYLPIYFLTYHLDPIPGLASHDAHPYIENINRFMKTDIGVGINETNDSSNNLEVSQNTPNPFAVESSFRIHLEKQSDLRFEIFNPKGEKAYGVNLGTRNPGNHKIIIDGSMLKPGMYFYTVSSDEGSITRKMIVE